ncbi:MAG: DNA internalization-related competence protein ComEC/Rec2 [Nitrospiraceae bacterium]
MLPGLTAWFLTGLLLGSYLPLFPILTFAVAGLCAVLLTGLEKRRPHPVRGPWFYMSLLAGILYWTLFLAATSRPALPDEAGRTPVQVVGTIVEPIQSSPDRMVMVLSEVQVNDVISGIGRIRVVWRSPDEVFRRGDRIQFTSRLRPPSGTVNPWGFDYAAYLERQGIDAVASVTGQHAVHLLRSGANRAGWVLWHRIDSWREHIRESAVKTLTQPALGVYLGMTTGERGYLTPEIRDDFMATGTVHILSISGSHLGLIAFLVFFFIRRGCLCLPAPALLRLSRRMTPSRMAAVLTTVPVTFYALLAGAEVATMRSLVMIMLFLVAVWLGHEKQLLSPLAFAALLIVLQDPRALFDISFQLSFLSVLAIALTFRWKRQDEEDTSLQPPSSLITKGIGWGIDSLRMTVVVSLATLPLVAYYFHQVAWMGLFANIIVVPIVGLVTVPIGLLSAVWLLLVGGDGLPAGPVNQQVLDLLIRVVRAFALVPKAEWHVATPAVPAVGIFFAMLYLATWPRTRKDLRFLAYLALSLLIGWWMWSPPDRLEDNTVRITFLDVGQGDASVIELPDGQTVLIDGGAAYDRFDMGRGVVAPYLWNRGIRRLDHVIGTHPQLDHVGGLAWIVEHFPVGRYWGNGQTRDEPFFHRLQQALAKQSLVEDIAVRRHESIISGPCRMTSVNPMIEAQSAGEIGRRTSGSHINNHSVVTRLDCGVVAVLFTGDVEREALARLVQSKDDPAQVVKVPHHGARSSLYLPWIEQTRPGIAVISAGRHNSYGHPAPLVLDAYQSLGIRLLRTDRDGAVWITASLSTSDFLIHTAKEWKLLPVPRSAAMWSGEMANLTRLWQQWVVG